MPKKVKVKDTVTYEIVDRFAQPHRAERGIVKVVFRLECASDGPKNLVVAEAESMLPRDEEMCRYREFWERDVGQGCDDDDSAAVLRRAIVRCMEEGDVDLVSA